MPTLIAFVSDLHVGSSVALAPNRVRLDDGGDYVASKPQRWIYDRWVEYWGEVSRLKDELSCEVVTVICGELADDNYHPTTQRISENKGDIIGASLAVLKPLRAVSDRIYATRGSSAHVGPSGGLDEAIAEEIGAIPDDAKHYARWIFRGVIDGVRVDAGHHPGTGTGRRHLQGNAANRLAVETQMGYLDMGLPFPHLVVRGHNHRPEDSGQNHKVRAVILPSWQLYTDFGYRITSGSNPLPIGGHLALADSGRVVWERQLHWQWPLMSKGWRKA